MSSAASFHTITDDHAQQQTHNTAAESSHHAQTHARHLLCSRSLLSVILGGQLLSLLITGSGVFSQLLANRGVNIPTSQSFINYLSLSTFALWRYFKWRSKNKKARRSTLVNFDSASSLVEERTHPSADIDPSQSESHAVHVTHHSYTNGRRVSHEIIGDGEVRSSLSNPASLSSSSSSKVIAPFLLVPTWKYLILAACDVEGNFLLVKAYQYTTITSVQLLDCFTIPVVMLLGCIVMRTTYNRKHYIGAFICLVGLSLLVTSDLISGRNDSGGEAKDKVLGDILVMIGCIFYAVSNLGQEYLVKSFDRFEFLGMLGVCGSFISAIQMSILERDALQKVEFSDPIVCAYLIGFNVCLFLLYYFTPLLLLHSSALFMNLSFLTSDFWSILFAVIIFHASLNLLYFAAFGIIIVGLIIYNLASVTDGKLSDLIRALCQPRDEHEEIQSRTDDDASHHELHLHTPISLDESPDDALDSLPTTHAHTHTRIDNSSFDQQFTSINATDDASHRYHQHE